MRIPWLGNTGDERCRLHSWRSTSFAGIAGALVALGFWEYRWMCCHVWDWPLFTVLITIAVVKLAFMTWYRFTN